MRVLQAIFAFLFCLVEKTLANLDHLDSEVELQCIQQCPLQIRTHADYYDFSCDYNCSIEQYVKGCKLRRTALSVSCQKACNGTTEILTPTTLYCVMGCNDAMTKYLTNLKVLFGLPPPPTLLTDSLSSTSLKLKWNFIMAGKVGLNCHLQWKFEEFSTSWQDYQNITWNQDHIFVVEGLQPYTKYRFRIALMLESHGYQDNNENLIVSQPSVVIKTLPSGVPSSPPKNIQAIPIDSRSISISWQPGQFSHGPLLSYVLQITGNFPEVYSEIKDIPSEYSFYMIHNVKPSRNYTIHIRMKNSYGSGPPATVIVSTPPESQIKDIDEEPSLIIVTDYSIFELTHMSDEPINLYSSKVKLESVGVHLNKKLLFTVDSDGCISKIPLREDATKEIQILRPDNLDFIPFDLTIDWLNDHLYVLGEVKHQVSKYIIKRCNFDGSNITVAHAELSHKPFSIEVDPFNGYLFWTIQDHNEGGLYRLDISDISDGIKHEVKSKKLINETELGACVIDYSHLRLLVQNQRKNTTMSVSLDGTVISNMRPSVTNSKLQKVTSFVKANGRFYWTDGVNVFREEYHTSYDSYFHNIIPHLPNDSYKIVFINLPNSQPWPVPVYPPSNVQANFAKNIAKISWEPPHLLGVQGKGAWQNWLYEVSVTEINTKRIDIHNNISSARFTINNLKENTEYVLKVSAYTKSGKGPSSEFRGITFSRYTNSTILWSTAEGLLKSSATGENSEMILPKSSIENLHITDIAWYRDQIYFVTNNTAYCYHLTSQRKRRLKDMGSVGSIAIDWIGKKFYWSNVKQQLITRSNLNGTHVEPLLTALAKDINVDSIKAYIYWSNGLKIECAHFNGADRTEYHNVQLFSGRQIVGLTLDPDHKYVYWIVAGPEGSILYKAPMQGYWKNQEYSTEVVSTLQKHSVQGPLCYFEKRLLWLQDVKNAAISDLSAKNIATISSESLWGLNVMDVVDSSLHTLPGDINSKIRINVIPEMVDTTSIKTVGTSESFNITWNPTQSVNYGTVFYEIQIDNQSQSDSIVVNTTTCSIKYWHEVTPYTPLNITLRAFTYWATSPQVKAEIFSPASISFAPRNLRSYVTFQETPPYENFVSIILRWNLPIIPNELLQGFIVRCWYIANDTKIDICHDAIIDPNKTEYKLSNLDNNYKVYYFEVQTYSEIGFGEPSEIVSVNASCELPLPVLLIASSSSILIDDIDANHSYSLIDIKTDPIEIAYIMKENNLYWINKKSELLMYNTLIKNQIKIIDILGEPKGITLDWIERTLYYIERDRDDTRSIIYKTDLNHIDRNFTTKIEIFHTSSEITKIEVSPFTKKIYWVETTENRKYNLMQSNTDGTEVELFFVQHKHNKRDLQDNSTICNCHEVSEIGPLFTLDHSNTKTKPLLLFVDSSTLNIMSTDKNGCMCNVVVNSSIISNHFPFNNIKSDIGNIYWTNPSKTVLYALQKREAFILTKEVKVSDILIFGQHAQPYPSKECQSPLQYDNFTVSLNFKTANSLNLHMPDPVIYEHCNNFSMASVSYTIFYKIYDNYNNSECLGQEECGEIITFDKNFNLGGLKAFTKYNISVAISNHFSDANEILIGPSITFQTASGVLSKPQNVSISVINPNVIRVNWLPPEELNGLIVYYELIWQTAGSLSQVRQKGEQPVLDTQSENNTIITTLLNKLSPNETYTIQIRAYNGNNSFEESFSESEKVQIITYPEPSSFELINRTSSAIKLSWEIIQYIKNYSVEFTPLASTDWSEIETTKENNNKILICVENLRPKTQYKFRLSLFYKNDTEMYVWPSDSRFTFETLGDKPSPPGIPILQYVKPNIYKMWWQASKDNGAPIELYKLEGRVLISYRNKRSTNRTQPWYDTSPSIEVYEPEWEILYNGTDTSWIINDLDEKTKYAFRVSALNSYGWSDTSEESNEFDMREVVKLTEKQNPMKLILIATTVPISICLLLVTAFFYVICSGKGKRSKIQQILSIPRVPDVELASLRELPRRGPQNTNNRYVSDQQTPEEITLLPHIRREQISLTKFLGSGAFGEVFEGKAKGIEENNEEIKVAIKTLRPGAPDQEKFEFLQEAQLMSHFKHEHILQLLGVCLDNDPHFIIMELMEGGDLLTYLRDSRNPSTNTPALNLTQLLKMCVDVTKGCKYLEEMNFVHRDLACRNCLVSSIGTDWRVVKIGDFGLARDLYKNDYYRKEGEGLLPVRWMAPESMVDGVFTIQSDVWAFGVLLWEIMTLGQLPYPVRANMEVLQYVKRGGRLGKPCDCPEDLYKLMLKCWEYKPEKRPIFKYCLDIVENIQQEISRYNGIGTNERQYISTVLD